MTYSKLYDKLINGGLKQLQLNRDYIIAETKRLVDTHYKQYFGDPNAISSPSTSYKAEVMKQVILKYNRLRRDRVSNRKNKIKNILDKWVN